MTPKNGADEEKTGVPDGIAIGNRKGKFETTGRGRIKKPRKGEGEISLDVTN